MNKPDGERIASLEQHMFDQDKKLDEIKSDIASIKTTLQNQTTLALQVNELQKDMGKLQQASGLWKWLGPTLTAIVVGIVGPIITLLVVSYINNL